MTGETKTTATGSQVQTSYAWKASGNIKSKTVGSTGTYYVWNADNRLVEVKQGSSEATAQTVAKYAYDTSGNRVAKVEPRQNGQPDKATSYLVDDTFTYANVVQESVTQGNATESTRYVWGMNLIVQGHGNQASYYHADGLNSVKALTDVAGMATDTYAYEAFGALAGKSGATGNAYRYTGEYFDEAIGLQYNRARWYDLSIARFVGMDPFHGIPKDPATFNKYAYAGNDPVDKLDPSGKTTLGELGAAEDAEGELASISPSLSYRALEVSRNAKIFDIYDYVTWPLHFYMYAERTGSMSGIRCDVGAPGGWGNLIKQLCRGNICGVIPGYVELSNATRSSLTGKGVKIVTLL